MAYVATIDRTTSSRGFAFPPASSSTCDGQVINKRGSALREIGTACFAAVRICKIDSENH